MVIVQQIKLAKYDPKGSSTGKLVTCDQDFCTSTFSAPFADCKVGQLCEYSITYGDGSSTAGYFVRDNIHFNRASGNLQTTTMNGSIAFGSVLISRLECGLVSYNKRTHGLTSN